MHHHYPRPRRTLLALGHAEELEFLPRLAAAGRGQQTSSLHWKVFGTGEAFEEPNPLAGAVALQGRRLFCFSVVKSRDCCHDGAMAEGTFAGINEDALVEGQQRSGTGIFGCDAHMVIRHRPASPQAVDVDPVNSTVQGSNDTSSMESQGSNGTSSIDSLFVNHWEEIRRDGRYRDYDWTVKAEPDTVFFPDRLRLHLKMMKPPAKVPMYIRSAFPTGDAMGPLQVMTREALELYFEKLESCSEHGLQASGHHSIAKCLDTIGVQHKSDVSLVHGTYLPLVGFGKINCADNFAAAFHPCDTVATWTDCHAQATAADHVLRR